MVPVLVCPLSNCTHVWGHTINTTICNSLCGVNFAVVKGLAPTAKRRGRRHHDIYTHCFASYVTRDAPRVVSDETV